MSDQQINYDIYSAMQEGTPYSSYKKTILGKVLVRVLNPWSDTPEEKIISGKPGTQDATINLWSKKEDTFFKNTNRLHLESGRLIPIDVQKPRVQTEEKTLNTLSDEEMEELLNKPFLALKNALNEMTDVAPVYRLEQLAEKQEKSERILTHIRSRISELQEESYKPK